MEIRQLSYFVSVAEFGSFSRAAAALQITQSALSKQIQNLEVELGERLLIRNGRGVETTPVGAMLFDHARTLLQNVAQTHEAIDTAKKGQFGKIIVGMPPAISSILAVPIARRLWSEFSNAQISVVHGRPDQLLDRMRDGKMDMAILFNASASPAFQIDKIVDETLYLFGSKKLLNATRRVTLQMLAELPMIVGSRSNSIRLLLDSELNRIGLTLNVILEIDTFESMDLVREGFGCTVTSMETFLARGRRLEGLIARPFSSSELILGMNLMRPTRRQKNKLKDAAYDIVFEVCQSLLGKK